MGKGLTQEEIAEKCKALTKQIWAAEAEIKHIQDKICKHPDKVRYKDYYTSSYSCSDCGAQW